MLMFRNQGIRLAHFIRFNSAHQSKGKGLQMLILHDVQINFFLLLNFVKVLLVDEISRKQCW